MENSAQVFNLLSDVPGDVQDVDELLQVLQHPANSIIIIIIIIIKSIWCHKIFLNKNKST